MANKRRPLTFSELDALQPKGRGAILRSPEELEAEQHLLENQEAGEPELQEAVIQEIQNDGIQENQKTRKPTRQIPSNTDTQLTRNRANFPKVTYRLSVEAIDAIEDMKRMLRRQYGVKVNLEEIAEEAILAAHRDLMERQKTSNLVKKFSGKPEIQKTRSRSER